MQNFGRGPSPHYAKHATPNQFHCACCRFREPIGQFSAYHPPQQFHYQPQFYHYPPAPNPYSPQYFSYQKPPQIDIKVEENSDYPILNGKSGLEKRNFFDQKSKTSFSQKTKTYRSKNDPLPDVQFKAKYFDPTSAPMMTSSHYAKIETLEKEHKTQMGKNKKVGFFDETQFPEKDKDPFIVYKYRRIKKKYRKYMEARGITTDFLDQKSDIDESESKKDDDQLKEEGNEEANFDLETPKSKFNNVEVKREQEDSVVGTFKQEATKRGFENEKQL